MPVFNYPKKEVNVKVVYYGPGLSGKTTNLQKIHDGIKPDFRGKLVSLATQTDRTLFFDFMPLELGSLGGYKVRLHLYTVPGQVHYNATRKLVLKGVDGVVFVADSQRAMNDANIESVLNLEKNLQSYGKSLVDLPHVIQANKRDLDDVISMEDVDSLLNHHGATLTEAAAAEGEGVMETLTCIVRLVMKGLKDQFASGLQDVPAPAPEPIPPVESDEPGGGDAEPGAASMMDGKAEDESPDPVMEEQQELETPGHPAPPDDATDQPEENVSDIEVSPEPEPTTADREAEALDIPVEVPEFDPEPEPFSSEGLEESEETDDIEVDKPDAPLRVLVPVEGVGTLELAINISARVLAKGEIKSLEVDVKAAALTQGNTSSVSSGVVSVEPGDVETPIQGSGIETESEALSAQIPVEPFDVVADSETLAEPEMPAEIPVENIDLPPLDETAGEPLGAPLDGQDPDPIVIPDLPQEEKILPDGDGVAETAELPAIDVATDYDPSVQPLDFDFPESEPDGNESKKKGLFGRFKKK